MLSGTTISCTPARALLHTEHHGSIPLVLFLAEASRSKAGHLTREWRRERLPTRSPRGQTGPTGAPRMIHGSGRVGSSKCEGVSNENEGGKLQDLMFHRVGNSRLLTLSLYLWIPSNFRHSLNRRTSGAFIPPVWIKHTGVLATPKSTRMYVRSVTFSLDNSSPQA